MIQRRTQNPAFWREEYEVDESDHEFLYETLADAVEPQSLDSLVFSIIQRRSELEEKRIRNELSRGLIYDPADSYNIGNEIVFLTLDFRLGKVLATREGENPEHGDFSVISVQFEDDQSERMFASGLHTAHKLNREGDVSLIGDGELMTAKDIYDEAGDAVADTIFEHLRQNTDYFINAGLLWLTTDQMVPVDVGLLNITEAALEMKGQPTSTADLFDLVELDPDVPESVRVFSLETAMHADERFVQVGSMGQHAWYLRRLVPDEAIAIPPALIYEPVPYERSVLDVELLQTEWEINDEWTHGGLAENVPAQVPSVIVHLIYPHLGSGTLPLTEATSSMFPRGTGVCTAVTLIDGRWGNRFRGWVMHEGRYVTGLGEWYTQHKLPVGARITIERSNNPDEIIVDFRPQRMKREWIRTARVENDRLVFQMLRQQITCEYDDQIALMVPDAESVAALADAIYDDDRSVDELVAQIIPELVKLSPQSTTHVKSIYSAVNAVRRTPPGPIFAALTRLPNATDTGSGFWGF